MLGVQSTIGALLPLLKVVAQDVLDGPVATLANSANDRARGGHGHAHLGGNIANVKYAVIWKEGVSALARKLLFYSKLSAGQFNVTTGNSLTITPSSNGYFELN